MAYILFCTMQIKGKLCTPAQFNPSCHSPWLVEPSPNVVSASRGCDSSAGSARLFSHLYLMAKASPAACGTCLAAGLDDDRIFSFFWLQWLGICPPPLLYSSVCPTQLIMKSRGVTPTAR